MPPKTKRPDLLAGTALRLQRSNEGAIFLVGVATSLSLIAEMVVLWLASPVVARQILQGLVAELFLGREGGLPLALQSGAPSWLVAQISLTQDIAMVCLLYPAFLWTLHHYHDRDNAFMRRLRRIEAAADRHQAYVHRWGPFGLFLFMLVPFLVNGPVVGSVLGRLCGLRTRDLLLPVFAATAIASFAWTYGYSALFQAADLLDKRLQLWITLGVIAILILLVAVGEIVDSRRRAKHRR